MQWIKDNKTEEFLRQFGVEFEANTAIAISELVNDWRTRNLGRPDKPILESTVEIYAEGMHDGKKFPFCVAIKVPIGYQLLDGTQRCAAVELLDGTSFAAYVVQCTNKRTLDCIAAGLNCIHGVRPGRELQISQAQMLMERHGMSETEAEATVGLKRGTLLKISNERAIRRLCEDANIDHTLVTNGKIETISRLLEKDGKMIPKVIELVRDGKLTGRDTEEVVESVTRCESVHDKLGAIDRMRNRADVQEKIHGRSATDPVQQLCQMIRAIDTYSKEHFGEMHFGSHRMRGEIETLWKRLDGRMKMMLSRGKAVVNN